MAQFYAEMAFKASYMMISLKYRCVTADNSYLTHSLQVYIHSLTTAPESRLFGSVEEHWIFNPAARVLFPPKLWDFFRPNLLYFSSLLRLSCRILHIERKKLRLKI